MTTRWKVEIKNGYGTIVDENGSFVGPLVDLELGWTDTNTGNYVDPDAEAAILHQIVREHNQAIEDAEHPERVIDKYFEDYSKLKRAHATMVACLEKARAALYNVPEVGKQYDQQHSHTHTQACLDIEAALRLAKGG